MAKKLDAITVSATIALRNRELREKAESLLKRQGDLQEDILILQRLKRNGESTTNDNKLLKELKETRMRASLMIGVLAMERTELLDDLPVIREATGQIKVISSELENDSALIERTAEKLKKATKALEKAEKLIVKIIGLVSFV